MIDLEKIKNVREKLKKMSRRSGEFDFFSPEEGKNRIRIIAPPGRKVPFKEVGYHFLDKTYLCPQVTNNERCPICEMVDKLEKSKYSEDIKLANKLRVYIRGAWIILDRKDNKVKVWTSSQRVFEDLIDYLADGDFGDFTDPFKGRDIILKRETPKNGITRYTVQFLDPEPIYESKKKIKELLESLPDLDSFVTKSYDDLRDVLEGFVDEEDIEIEDVEDEEKKKKKVKGIDEEEGTKKKFRKRSRLPECFGEYDENDEECQECEYAEKCKKYVSEEVEDVEDDEEDDNEDVVDDEDEKEDNVSEDEDKELDELFKKYKSHKKKRRLL